MHLIQIQDTIQSLVIIYISCISQNFELSGGENQIREIKIGVHFGNQMAENWLTYLRVVK